MDEKPQSSRSLSSKNNPLVEEGELDEFTTGHKVKRMPDQDHLIMDLDFDELDDPQKLTRLHFELLRKIDSHFKKPYDWKQWINPYATFLKDGRDYKEISQVLRWGFKSDFWMPKLKSPQDFIKHYQTMILQQKKAKEDDVQDPFDMMVDYMMTCNVVSVRYNVEYAHSGGPEDWHKELTSKGLRFPNFKEFNLIQRGEDPLRPPMENPVDILKYTSKTIS